MVPGTACWPPNWDDRTLSQGLAGHTLGWGGGEVDLVLLMCSGQ